MQATGGVEEADGFADVAYPVVGGGEPGLEAEVAGPGGDDGDGRRGVDDLLGDGSEPVEHVVHVRGVKSVADRQPPDGAAAFGPADGDALDEVGVAGDDGGARAVDGGDLDPPGEPGEGLGDLRLAGADGGHGSAGAAGLHEPAAGRDESAGVVEGPHSGDVGGGELADGVPGEDPRGETPGFEEPEQRGLEGEQRGLGVLGAVERRRARGTGGGEHDVAQWVFEMRREVGTDVVEGVGEGRVGRMEFAAHPGALAALPGEQEGGCAPGGSASAQRRSDRAQDQPGGGAGLGQSSQDPGQGPGPGQVRAAAARRRSADDGDGAVLEVGATRQGVSRVQGGDLGMALQVRAEPGGRRT